MLTITITFTLNNSLTDGGEQQSLVVHLWVAK